VSTDLVHEVASPIPPEQSREIKRVTWIGLGINLVLTAFKFAGGVLGNSQAVVADAVHSLSDTTTDVAILLGVRYWDKPADKGHPHGHRRLETMVTLSIGLALGLVAGGLLWSALTTLQEHHASAPGWIALSAAAVSIVCKELLYRWTAAAGRRVRSMPLVANAWHHRSDALSSIPAVLAVAGAIYMPAWSFLDHIGAVAVSLFIFQAAYKIMKPACDKLLDSSAPQHDLQQIRALAAGVEGVRHVHGLRTRYLSCSTLAVDLHIEVEGSMSVRRGHDISEVVKQRILAYGPDVIDVVVHLEPYDETREDSERGTSAFLRGPGETGTPPPPQSGAPS